MDADTRYVESEHDVPDHSGSKIESNQSEVLHTEDVQKEKHATNNIDGSDEGDNALDSVSSLSGSLLTPPVKLVSAMKGSREKEGVATRKMLTVNWAPDVYDPPPTDLEALLTKGTKQQKVPKKEKKAGKKQQKGKDFMQASISGKESSKAGGGKDKKKKQQRRGPGRLKNYNMFDDVAGPTLFSGSVEDDDSYNSKGWDSGKKKREKVGFVRNYDLPPSDDDSEDSDENTVNGGKKDKQSHEKIGKQRSYDLPPEEDDEEEEEEEASHGKSTSGGKKNMQSLGNLGKQRSYDLPPEEDDEEDEEEEEDSKFSSGGKKNKQNHGNLRQQRCYDLPPDEDEDEDEEEEGLKNPNHGSSFRKHSLKEVHHSVAKAR